MKKKKKKRKEFADGPPSVAEDGPPVQARNRRPGDGS